MKLLLSILLAAVTAFGVVTYNDLYRAPTLGTFNLTGGGVYRLQSSIGSTNTSITLSSFKEPVSNIPYTMSYLQTDIIFGTLDPQNPSRKEFISATGVTQNPDGTATLTGVTRGLSFTPDIVRGCVASSTLAQSHSGQSIFILSDSPCVFTQFLNTQNVATSSNILIFSSTTPPRYDFTAAQASGSFIATTSELASVAYVNAVSFSGTTNATEATKGIIQLGTALQVASSTNLGSTGASLVLQSKNATDTPSVGCATGYSGVAGAGCSVIATLTGKIRQTWLDLSESFTFANLTATNATLVNATSTGSFYIGSRRVQPLFGGDGSDGALALTSGTTTIDLGSATFFERNYSSISITGTGHLAFSNPAAGGTFIVLRSQGNVTLTCSPAPCIEVSGLGADGGAGAAGAVNNSNIGGTSGTAGNAYHLFKTNAGVGGTTAAGTAGAVPTVIAPSSFSSTTLVRYGGQFWVGAGGGGGGCVSGGSVTCSGGDGGKGGGGLLMEVGGALNMTTTNAIMANGDNGGTGAMSGSGEHAGGGGGAGGFVMVLYNLLTSASGTISVSGGTGGNSNSTNFSNGTIYGGGGAATGYTAGSAGTDQSSSGAKTGGDGASGVQIIKKNSDIF